MWVFGGYAAAGYDIYADVRYSTDGITWTKSTQAAPFGGRWGQATLVFDGRMWVIGGWDGTKNLNDVWYSSDGINWSQATSAAAFPARLNHRAVAFAGKMWVIGGCTKIGHTSLSYTKDDDPSDYASYLGDVWSSTDGVTWQLATGEAPFGRRENHASVVYDGKMWVIAGQGEPEGYKMRKYNDTWSSADGVNWTRATNSFADSPSYNLAAMVFHDKMYVVEEVSEYFSSDGASWSGVFQSVPYSLTGKGNGGVGVGLVYDGKMWLLGAWSGSYTSPPPPEKLVYYSSGPW